MDVCLLWVLVLSGRGLCDGLITISEEFYRVWCVCVSVISKPRQWEGLDQPGLSSHERKKYLRALCFVLKSILKWLSTNINECHSSIGKRICARQYTFLSGMFYLLIVVVQSYYCTWLHSMTHAHTHTLGWTPLDEGSARRKVLYVHNTQHIKYEKKPIRSVGFAPVIPASGRP